MSATSKARKEAKVGVFNVLKEYLGSIPEKELKKRLRDAYPWGALSGWKYQLWRQECRLQVAALSGDAKPVVKVRTRSSIPLFEQDKPSAK